MLGGSLRLRRLRGLLGRLICGEGAIIRLSVFIFVLGLVLSLVLALLI